LRERFTGIELPTDRPLYRDFVERLPSFVPNGRAHGYNILYDALYMTTYAAQAAGVINLTPDKLADALTRLDGGTLINVGTTGDTFTEGIQLLLVDTDGDAFKFHGTSGLLEWDDTTGARKTQLIGTYCLAADGTGAVVYDFGRRLYDPVREQFVNVEGVEPNQGSCFASTPPPL
ncbi:MAG TPA: hypothetical protein VFB62_12445, partial [Polyangiaceae bacterium]|nr:hypothetical protein [Polyangiaceae bacterium]